MLFTATKKGYDFPNTLSVNNTQLLKGIAATLIIFGHCTAIDRSSILCKFNVGWYCVALFMFISGWGITYSYKYKLNYLQHFWGSRFYKIAIPFLSAHLIYAVVKIAYGETFSIYDIFAGVLGQCTVVDNSWYPVAAIVFYFLFWFVFQLHIAENIKPLLLAVVAMVVTFLEFKIFGLASDWWFISNFAFPIGVILCFYDSNLVYRKRYFEIAIAGYVLGYCMIPGYHILFGEYNNIIYVLASNLRSAFLSVFIIMGVSYFSSHSKTMSILGRISYEMYLVHGLFIFIFSHYLDNIVLLFVFTFSCSVFSAYFLNVLHRKMYKCFSQHD